MSKTDLVYFARRADEEERRAAASELPVVRSVHLELAAAYRARVAALRGAASLAEARLPGSAATAPAAFDNSRTATA